MKKMKAKNRTDLAIRAQIPIAASMSMAALSPSRHGGLAVRVQPCMEGADDWQ
jgi:hypothetical protein